MVTLSKNDRLLNQDSRLANGLIILSSAAHGGIADYLHWQANALVEAGIDVTLVGPRGAGKRDGANYSYTEIWTDPPKARLRIVRRALFLRNLLQNTREFAKFLETRPERNVLFGAFFEYAAPLWAWRFRRLVDRGWRFATVIHDPIRDFVVGPLWWHRRSIREAYSFVTTGFVHGRSDAVELAGNVRLVSIPMGSYPFPESVVTGDELRRSLGIDSDAFVILAFGHIRDGKNLDLLIQAIVDHPKVHLVVAGKEQSSGQKPAGFYRAIADRLGVADRCHFETRHIAESEVGGFFESADLIALTYSRSFRSASSALAACANYQKPCIASSGCGPLQDLIQEYQLGVWVEPDSVDAIRNGLLAFRSNPPVADWDRYEKENSWQRNAEVVIQSLSQA